MKKTILLILFLLEGGFLSAQPVESTAAIVQWIKMTEYLLNNNISYQVRAENFEYDVIDCGYECKIYKLTTTPFSEEGALIISLSDIAGCRGRLAVPFHVEKEKLITPLRTYSVSMDGNYCGPSFVKVIVTLSDLTEGYAITLSGE